MSETVTLELDETLLQSAHMLAAKSNRRVEDVLVEWIDRAASEVPVELLSDDQILLLCSQDLGSEEQATLSELLDRHREGMLTPADHQALDAVMGTYRFGLVRKAQAMKVAVERGLRPALDPA
jgi:hypothetical protein